MKNILLILLATGSLMNVTFAADTASRNNCKDNNCKCDSAVKNHVTPEPATVVDTPP